MLSDQIYELLKRRIIEGTLAPQSQISDIDLAEQLQVSRSPLRVALQRLAGDGLVSIYAQFGSFVSPISLEAVEQAQFIREHLECALVRDVVAKIDARGKDLLLKTLDKQQSAYRDGNPTLFYELDEDLHHNLAKISGREGVGLLIEQQKAHLDRVRHLSLPMFDQIPKLIEQHTTIVDNIVKGDAVAAEANLRLHLREIFSVIENLGLRRQQEVRLPKRSPAKRQQKAGT
jgi:DNA-binding GntR family transcriptional regulator